MNETTEAENALKLARQIDEAPPPPPTTTQKDMLVALGESVTMIGQRAQDVLDHLGNSERSVAESLAAMRAESAQIGDQIDNRMYRAAAQFGASETSKAIDKIRAEERRRVAAINSATAEQRIVLKELSDKKVNRSIALIVTFLIGCFVGGGIAAFICSR